MKAVSASKLAASAHNVCLKTLERQRQRHLQPRWDIGIDVGEKPSDGTQSSATSNNCHSIHKQSQDFVSKKSIEWKQWDFTALIMAILLRKGCNNCGWSLSICRKSIKRSQYWLHSFFLLIHCRLALYSLFITRDACKPVSLDFKVTWS